MDKWIYINVVFGIVLVVIGLAVIAALILFF